MADLLSLSARLIDDGVTDEPSNRVTQELSELDDDLALIESFSHIVVFRTDDGLVCFDATGPATGQQAVESLRGWSDDRVHTLVYTHGHLDHVGGSGAFVADARRSRRADPSVVAHEAVLDRFRRYRRTDGFNLAINARQFGGVAPRHGMGVGGVDRFLPDDVVEPDHTYARRTGLRIGDLRIELHHARGETDDHTWAWVPDKRAVCVGDFLTWVFPNAGNPQKVQRYPEEWAAALRDMAALEPELVLPAHGLPIAGRDRIATVLDQIASVLEHLVTETLSMMNAGAALEEIVHTVRVPETTLALPYLRPVYDEPEFVVRNVWRRYGGWWDGDAARLKPPTRAALASELAALAGGATPLADRAAAVAAQGDHRLACELVELAAAAAPDDAAIHGRRAEIYRARRAAESSLMAKGIYAAAARESEQRSDPIGQPPPT
ncbi:MAG: alkyl sulfatase dimerization domain-containing protein [Actinomycetota bacterium]|nr:alkyl sulfatase dimerization domain-containing protein [Actinomycetota bacterium]